MESRLLGVLRTAAGVPDLEYGRPPQPLGVVISRSGHVPFDIPLFACAESRVAVYAPAGLVVPPCSAQVTVHELPPGDDDLAGVLRSLRRDHGIRSLLCEGGPALFTALLDHNLVDELFLTVSPRLFGRQVGDGRKALVDGVDLAGALTGLGLTLASVRRHESYLFLRYDR